MRRILQKALSRSKKYDHQHLRTSGEFDEAVIFFEEIISNVQPDEEALTSLKGRWLKGRENSKLNKRIIVAGLRRYAQFGAQNPFNTVISYDALYNCPIGAKPSNRKKL